MVASEDHARWVQTLSLCDLQYGSAKVFRLESCIAAVVIDLVGGGLDQDVRVVVDCLLDRGFQYPWVRGAN
jgi:hypothetical protein